MTPPTSSLPSVDDSKAVQPGTRDFPTPLPPPTPPEGAAPAGRTSARDLWLCFVVAAAVDIVVGGRLLPGVLAGGLVNPDSYMRLVRLDEIISSGQVLDSVMRDGSGRGTQLHWSHLIESLLVLLAQPLLLFLPWREALHAVAAAFGPLSMGAMGMALAWAAAPLAARRFLWLAAVLGGLAQPLAAYSIPGVVHHHLPLALVVVMLAGWGHRALGAWPPAQRPGAAVALGAWAGLGLWFTAEAVPFVLLAFGFAWLGWLVAPRNLRLAQAAVVRAVAFGFAAVVLGAFAVDPPVDGGRWFVAFDRLSVVYVVLVACTTVAALLTVPVQALRLAPVAHFVAGGVAGAVALGAWFAIYPELFGGAAGLVAPEEYDAMLGSIAEMQPLQGVSDLVAFLLTGLIGAGVVVLLAWRGGTFVGWVAAAVAVLVVVAGLLHLRLTAYPAALGAAMVPVALTLVSAVLARRGETVAALGRVGLLAVAVLVPLMGALAGGAGAAPRGACKLADAARLLDGHAGRIVLSDVDDTPELLYRTRVHTVGSLYWSRLEPGESAYLRSTRNFMTLRAAWRSRPDTDGAAAVRAAKAELVLHCPRARRSVMVADLPVGTLLDLLDAGTPPAFLVEVGRAAGAGYVLYEVR